MNSRDKILQNIKSALKTPSRLADDPAGLDTIIRDKIAELTPNSTDDLIDQFSKELEIVSAEFFVAGSEEKAVQFIEKILKNVKDPQMCCAGSGLAERIAAQLDCSVVHPQEENKISTLANINTSLVDVEFAIAESATLVIPFNKTNSSLPHFLPDTVIALVRTDQLIANQFELFETLDTESAKNMLLVTGPSRTADIEKILILGAHGPRRLIVIMIENT